MRAIVMIGAAICAALCSSPAVSQAITFPHTLGALYACYGDTTYSAAGSNTPQVLAHSFDGQGKVVTFRICKDADGNTHYFIRKPRPNRDGVCRVAEDEIFPGAPDDGAIVDVLYDGAAPGWYFVLHGWTSRPPQEWLAGGYRGRHTSLALVTSAAAPCPPTDDRHYIPVSATDGMLKAFFQLWRSATASPSAFNRRFALVPVLPAPPFPPADPAGVRNMLGRAVFERHEEVAAIICMRDELGTDSGCNALVGGLSILFDVTAKGLAITGIRANPVI